MTFTLKSKGGSVIGCCAMKMYPVLGWAPHRGDV